MNKIRYYSWLFLDNKYLRLLYRLDYFNIIKKNNNKYLIKLIKSYNNFKKEKNLTFLDKIESDIEKINLHPDKKYFQKIFNGIDIKITNSILHQLVNKYLSKKFGLFSISRSILISKYNNSNLIYPYPKEVLRSINKNIKVNFFLSSIIFFVIKILFFFYGIKTLLNILFINLKYFLSKKKYDCNSFYFVNLSEDNFNNPNGHSIFNWIKDIAKRKNIINFYHDSVNVNSFKFNDINIENQTLYKFNSFIHFSKFIIWSIIYIPLYFLLTLFGKWYYPLIFSEIIKAKIFDYQNKFSKNYYFNNSNYIFRPLWTYIAEKKGSNIIFFFYSNNIDRIKTFGNYQYPPRYWSNTSWSNYYIWDNYNKFFLEKYTFNQKKFIKTGPIWFGDKIHNIQFKHKKFLTVFDVSPSRPLFYKTLFFSDDYNIFENTKKYIDDIYEICEKNEIYIYFKQKRLFTNIHDKRYINLINNYKSKKFFIYIDPTISVFSIINLSKGIVSFPFTSTNIIANNFNILNTYYDPTSSIDLDENVSHGLNFIKNKKSLENWIKKINF